MKGLTFKGGPAFEELKERELRRRGQSRFPFRTQYEVDELRFKAHGGVRKLDIRELRRGRRRDRRRRALGLAGASPAPDLSFRFADVSTGQLADDGGLLVAEQGGGKKRRGLDFLFRRQVEEPAHETGPTPAAQNQDGGLIFPKEFRNPEDAARQESDALRALFAADTAALPQENNVDALLNKEDAAKVLRAMSTLTLRIHTPDLKKIEKGEAGATRVDPLRIKKADDELQIIWGEVYVPLFPDSQGDFMTAEEVRKAAYRFAAQGRLDQIDRMHDGDVCGAVVVETFIARGCDDVFIEDAWVIGCHIPDPEIWAAVKSGEFNGFSMEGEAVRHEKQFEIDLPEEVRGTTQEEENHTHPFVVRFGPQGQFMGGEADPEGAAGADIHTHKIQKGTVTEVGGATPHAHRYSFAEGILEVAIGRVPPTQDQMASEG